jgi:CRP-like cAMP-binding protein
MKNRLLDSLPFNEQAWIASFFLDRTFDKGSVLQEAGRPIEHVYFPKSGLVTLLGVLPGVAEIDTAMVGPEGAIGAAAGIGMQKAFGRAVVQIPGRFAQISAVRFAEWASRSAAVRDMILRYHEGLLAQIQHSVVCTAVHDSQGRLCRWLLQARDRIGGGTLSLTQECLSGILGLQRTTITLICCKLQSEGILRVRRGRIEVLDIGALRARACECYHLMHSLTANITDEPQLNVPELTGINLAAVQDGPLERPQVP